MTLQPKTHHRLSTCHRHPTVKPLTGFCASCLCERLSSIDSTPTTTATTPRLRRTKSFSANNNPNASTSTVEPRRKSCDVGTHQTLSNLFTLDDHLKAEKRSAVPINLGFELKENVEVVVVKDEDEGEDGELKTMKEFIDLELESKKSKVSIWETASVFSKKLLNWKQKQQQRKNNNNNKREIDSFLGDDNKPSSIRGTESEIGLYGLLGRRSCDTDPRLSVDNGRYSFDEPRASWDGILIGKAYPRLITPMAAVEEKVSLENEVERSPGGSAQTRDYYGESLNLQRRRRSFDRSSSGKRVSLVDVDEVKSISNAKISPETVGLFHGAKLLVTEKELRDSNWYSIKDYGVEGVESASKNVGYVADGVSQKGLNVKKSLKWRNVWNMLGFIQKRSEGKCGGDEERRRSTGGGNVDVVDGPLAESWQKLKRVANGEANGTVSEKLIRSYSVSARNSCKVDGLFHGVEAKDNVVGGRKRDELVLHRNRSSGYSPSNLENGLLRFYLTPVRSYRRSKSGSKLKNSHSVTMSGL